MAEPTDPRRTVARPGAISQVLTSFAQCLKWLILSLVFSILNTTGQLWLTAGQPERGLRLIVFVRDHASHRPAQDEAQQILDAYATATQEMLTELLATVQAQLSGRTLEDIVLEVVETHYLTL